MSADCVASAMYCTGLQTVSNMVQNMSEGPEKVRVIQDVTRAIQLLQVIQDGLAKYYVGDLLEATPGSSLNHQDLIEKLSKVRLDMTRRDIFQVKEIKGFFIEYVEGLIRLASWSWQIELWRNSDLPIDVIREELCNLTHLVTRGAECLRQKELTPLAAIGSDLLERINRALQTAID